ncbi:MAG: hypothetical protein ACRD1Z_19245 [Vicinamibacteria bacterium]
MFREPRLRRNLQGRARGGRDLREHLAYLNNPMAEGKSYCGGTTVRQGWTEVSCEDRE